MTLDFIRCRFCLCSYSADSLRNFFRLSSVPRVLVNYYVRLNRGGNARRRGTAEPEREKVCTARC